MDYLKQERERGITITSAAITFGWNKHKINLIDTPGHVDFTIEVERSVRVLDGAVALLDAVAGVEAQTETVWRQADRHHVPRIAFINKMDKVGASHDRVLASVRKKLGANPFLVQLPVLTKEGDFTFEIISLPEMELLRWRDNSGFDLERVPLSQATHLDPAVVEKAVAQRVELVEALTGIDDHLMGLYVEREEPSKLTARDLHDAIKRVTLARSGIPVLLGASFKNRGVQPLMDAVVNYLPSPLERPSVTAADLNTGERVSFTATTGGADNTCALAFKVVHDKQRGPLVFLRVYSGELRNKMNLRNTTKEKTERVNKLLQAYANNFEEVEQVGAGNIAVAVGLSNTSTGDTLLSTKERRRLALDGMRIPPPVFFRAIEPASPAQEKALEAALTLLKLEDPSFNFSVDPESLQTVVSGMGELHLEIIADRLKTELKVDAELGPIRISYREALDVESGAEFTQAQTYDREVGGRRQFARLTVKMTTADTDECVIVPHLADKDHTKGMSRADLSSAIIQGVQTSLSRGPLLAFPYVGLRVDVNDVEVTKDSTADAFRVAAFEATRQILAQHAAVMMEPVMKVEVTLPDQHIGSVASDLTGARRGVITSIDSNGTSSSISASVPLGQMIGYSNHLRSVTSGTGTFSLEFAKYERMSGESQAALLKRL